MSLIQKRMLRLITKELEEKVTIERILLFIYFSSLVIQLLGPPWITLDHLGSPVIPGDPA